jgi:hypothetical protein
MCVVRRSEIIPVLNPENKPIWGIDTGRKTQDIQNKT